VKGVHCERVYCLPAAEVVVVVVVVVFCVTDVTHIHNEHFTTILTCGVDMFKNTYTKVNRLCQELLSRYLAF
jgi:hypothetical protein